MNQLQLLSTSHTPYNSKDVVVGFRHFEDVDAIKTYGLDGPLQINQHNEQLVQRTAGTILEVMERQRVHCLRIIYSPKLKRLRESAVLVGEAVSRKFAVLLEDDDDLRPFEQGIPRLPPDYKDGERLPVTLGAWEAYCQATYVDRDIHYRFGDPVVGTSTRENLNGQFEKLGESEAEYLIRKYRFLLRLLSRQNTNELVAFCSQTNPLLFIREIFAIEKDGIDPIPEDLHFLCWRYFLDAIADRSRRSSCHQENLINELKRHDLGFGETLLFDLSGFDIMRWREILTEAQQHLLAQQRKHSVSAVISA